MNRDDIKRLIESSETINDFISGGSSCLPIIVHRIPIFIYKEGIGGSYYYRLPYCEQYDYYKVAEFMRFAIPIISKMIEERREEKLSQPDF